jgi:hypothetical protein
MNLLAVAASLQLDEPYIYETIPPAILHGLMTMLPLAQHFPENHYIVIETSQGVCSIVVWAYLLLGLRVLVRLHSDSSESSCTEFRFPPHQQQPEQMLLDVVVNPNPYKKFWGSQEPTVVLLSTSTREELIKLKADQDDQPIDSSITRPARGIANYFLDKATPQRTGRERIMQEMRLISCWMALCVAHILVMKPPDGQAEILYEAKRIASDSDSDDDAEDSGLSPYHISVTRIIDASRLLFDTNDRKSPLNIIEQYASSYKGRKLLEVEEPPQCIIAIFEKWDRDSKTQVNQRIWPQLRYTALKLSILILAFAHVTDIDQCCDLPLYELDNLLGRSSLFEEVKKWNGTRHITVKVDVWLEILSLMIIGHVGDDIAFRFDLQKTCLVSNQGWSLYINTFGDSDPADRGRFALTP